MAGNSGTFDAGEAIFLVVAAGRGARAGAGGPKQYRELAGRQVLTRTLEALLNGAPEARALVTIHPDDLDLYQGAVAPLPDSLRERLLEPVFGGATRQDSVCNGLEALAALGAADDASVLIHDAARPFVAPGLIARALDAAREKGAAVPGLPVIDTIKKVAEDERIVATPERATLRAVQTPQAFRLALILAAHRAVRADGCRELTDDAAVAEWAGHCVFVFPGEAANIKLTTAEDFLRAETRMLNDLPDVRTGQGFDVHAFGEGDHVWLGGVQVPHDHGLVGHSDADVLLHAITDAVLGAIADGDIGAHFPPSDPQWRGAASDRFLRHAVARVAARGGRVAHIDATLICERPKVGPHRDAIRAQIAEIMDLPLDRVAVKATTSERLGFTGRQEGIAALAMATVRLP
ncbi:bifunctional 2-C-methyl-D-erythritol 4-phosphate cytidylyltransferase/2-C-methyl-D-erythritol 2,4-cyclodiphosphate synthase [Rhodoblastus sp. 17X3]|uniref:bifunctional 2-C-methyl-D-erythritol 4-phosphate cytidylyltransferase/2-C-methyl-D-erythritol 2,4-cyclodiphosphate synthase n=1 Tax=Rhodoblastus sp. 17X3 TaxID=3047026 RepID=UPI0024B85B41|nr:bifunctional 2-C-methyl-D-erythritol 4-phosphate cytidylyltransferase/2-C-methyl-D-erythritol 2,4-cyclodiphosphate synthase [Rhodoblastus sp. 17X3]MDI9849610.1 bifunctional 2-C-methyl-D-erythritol 4-phosphate cytidylyltransferase/2-C-methyl-D-erythritol 2,4-cyclodiphosphate synthase [Rhodoblastus sp. 17X3]